VGFDVRRYHDKLLIKLSKAAMRRIREQLWLEVKALQGVDALTVIGALSPADPSDHMTGPADGLGPTVCGVLIES
jgi:hypothetical protein